MCMNVWLRGPSKWIMWLKRSTDRKIHLDREEEEVRNAGAGKHTRRRELIELQMRAWRKPRRDGKKGRSRRKLQAPRLSFPLTLSLLMDRSALALSLFIFLSFFALFSHVRVRTKRRVENHTTFKFRTAIFITVIHSTRVWQMSSGTAILPVQIFFSHFPRLLSAHVPHSGSAVFRGERQKLHGWRLLTEFSPLLNGVLSGIPESS